ncbi:kinase-like domain-containing protein [Mariannaea sp. PMI_226]|nr:kinase-like domain-containing protein [Mariannaea sp. PMI_226]
MGLIHPAHYRGHDENGSGHAVAIKDFSHGTLRVFKREKEYLQRIRSLSSRHVMKAIATCTRGSSYYIFFPWATGGNLKDFWKLETTRRTRLPTRWSLNQMLGIATALQSLNIFGDEYQDFEPKDILHFRGKGVETGTLVLRVTATSKFTPMYARGSRNQPRITWYRAPELRPLPRFTRRRHNSIWSMGCILLEHVIWLLYGHKILVQFKASWRLEDLGNDPNKFYTRDTQEMETISLDGGIRRAVDPSPKVLVRVIYGMLKKDANCREGTMLGDLVNLIFQDLLILPGRHEGYEKFVTKLREIKERADRAPSYLCTEFDDVVAKQGFIDSLPEAGEKDFMIADW